MGVVLSALKPPRGLGPESGTVSPVRFPCTQHVVGGTWSSSREATVLSLSDVSTTGVTKWPDSRNQEAQGEGSQAKGQAGLAAVAPCLVPFDLNSHLKWPGTVCDTSSLQVACVN